MAVFIVRRLAQGFVVLVLASLAIYTILIISPGGPADQLQEYIRNEATKGREPNPAYVNSLIHAYNLDKPWPLNYAAWLFDPSKTQHLDPATSQLVQRGVNFDIFGWHIAGSGVLTGDFGDSIRISPGVPVADLLGSRMVNTLFLTVGSLLFSILIAFPIGIISAIKQYSKLDYSVTTFSFLGLSMPTFWLGLMLIIFLSNVPSQLHFYGLSGSNLQEGWTWLPYLPPGQATDIGKEGDLANRLYHLILPVTVLSFVSIAGLSRYVRSSMLEVLKQDYVRTAWAKGLSQRVVILKHALRNALIPLITVLTLSLPGLVAGAIITETIFAYAGLGQLFYFSITQLDLTVALGFLVMSTVAIIVSNILADVLYAVADPRIRYS